MKISYFHILQNLVEQPSIDEISQKLIQLGHENTYQDNILDIEFTPNDQIILSQSLAWLDGSVKERMECGDHWVIYAEVLHGNVLKSDSLTAVHHRKTGANY